MEAHAGDGPDPLSHETFVIANQGEDVARYGAHVDPLVHRPTERQVEGNSTDLTSGAHEGVRTLTSTQDTVGLLILPLTTLTSPRTDELQTQ